MKDGLTWSTNRYSDVSQFPDGSDMKVWERRLLYCVPVRFFISKMLIFVFVVYLVTTLDCNVGPRTKPVD